MSSGSSSSSFTPDNNNNPGRTLPESVRWAVDAFVKYQTAEGSVDTVDVYRCIREQANLLFERQVLLDAIQSDPFRQFQDIRPKIRNLKDRLDVTSCSRIMTWEGYALIQATVHISKPSTNSTATPSFSLQFRYERQPSQNKVCYSIDMVADAPLPTLNTSTTTTTTTTTIEPPQGSRRVLEIEVWTVGSRGPSILPARPIEMDDVVADEELIAEDENQDGMEVEEEEHQQKGDDVKVKQGTKTNGNRIPVTEINHEKNNKQNPTSDTSTTTETTITSATKNKKARMEVEATNEEADNDGVGDNDDDDDHDDDSQLLSSDRYSASLDPDILSDFIEWSHLQPMPDVTAFFLLMTFPYYELEWDLIGMVLDSAFDDNEEDHEEEEDEDDKHASMDDDAKHGRTGETNSDDDWDDDDEDDDA